MDGDDCEVKRGPSGREGEFTCFDHLLAGGDSEHERRVSLKTSPSQVDDARQHISPAGTRPPQTFRTRGGPSRASTMHSHFRKLPDRIAEFLLDIADTVGLRSSMSA